MVVASRQSTTSGIPRAGTFGARVAGLAAVRLLSVAAGFASVVIGARLIGSDGLGAAGVAITLGTIGAVTCNGGINISTIYLLGRHHEKGRDIIGPLSTIALVGALLAASVLVALGPGIAPAIGLAGRDGLIVAAAALAAIMIVFEFSGAVLLGLARNRAYILAELLKGAGTLVFTAALLLSAWPSDAGFVVAAIVAQGTAAAFAMQRAVKAVGVVAPTINTPLMGEALGIGLRGQAGNVLQFLNLRLDQLLVPALLSLSSAGVYLVAVRVSEALAQLGGAAGSLIFPEVARQADPQATAVTERAVRVLIIMIVAIGLVIGLLADLLLAVAFGPEFSEGALALRFLLVAMLPLSVARILAGDLKGRGRAGLVSIAMGMAVVVTIVLDLVLIPRFGIEGAAAASVVAYSSTALALTLAFLRLTGADGRQLVPRRSDIGALLRYVARVRGMAS